MKFIIIIYLEGYDQQFITKVSIHQRSSIFLTVVFFDMLCQQNIRARLLQIIFDVYKDHRIVNELILFLINQDRLS